MSDDPRFAEPLYTVAQAARLVGMSPSTLASWAKGYRHRFPDRPTVAKGPVITSLAPNAGATIPFVGLVEAIVVQAFRRTELPLQRIRKALDVLAAEGDIAHPLASRRLYTDGAEVLYDYATDAGDGQLRLLTVVSSGQRVFDEVVDAYLRRVHFADDPWASEVIVPVTPRGVAHPAGRLLRRPGVHRRRCPAVGCRLPPEGWRIDRVPRGRLRHSAGRPHRGSGCRPGDADRGLRTPSSSSIEASGAAGSPRSSGRAASPSS